MTEARKLHRLLSLVLLGLGVMMLSGLLPASAFAASTSDLKGTTIQVGGEISWVAKLIAFLSYVVGTAFAARALFALKNFIQAPDDNPINRVIGFATASALLILLPASLMITQTTIGADGQPRITGSAPNFKATDALAACTQGASLNAVFCNIAKEVSPFANLMATVAYVMAVNLTLTGLLNLKAYGDDPSQTPIRSVIMKFVLATMLISLPLAMQVFITTVTGASSVESASKVSRPKLFSGTL